MDPRRRLTIAAPTAAAAVLAACAHVGAPPPGAATPAPATPLQAAAPPPAAAPAAGGRNREPIPYLQAWPAAERPARAPAPAAVAPPPASGPSTNLRHGDARGPVALATPAPADRTEGGLRIFGYAPGRVFTVRTSPLRVTMLGLEPGEVLIETAAGDTVRWRIGQTASGQGASERALVMIKPMSAGLATNMVLTTSRRVYLIDLVSGGKGFDPAIAWSYPQAPQAEVVAEAAPAQPGPGPSLQSAGAGYRILPRGRAPVWTPRAVFDDGRRTYIVLPPDLERGPTPVLLVDDEAGRPTLANYRVAGDLIIVDRLFEAAELRLGDRRPAVVRIMRRPREIQE